VIESIALWLAQELLKFLAARLFRGQLQAIFDRWDQTPASRFWPSASEVRQSRDLAVHDVTGQIPTAAQQQVLQLIYDPIRAAKG
jgi:hypothetical protein